MVMSVEERRAIARKRGVSEKTVRRWEREDGEASARRRSPTSKSEAGRRARRVNPGYGEGAWK